MPQPVASSDVPARIVRRDRVRVLVPIAPIAPTGPNRSPLELDNYPYFARPIMSLAATGCRRAFSAATHSFFCLDSSASSDSSRLAREGSALISLFSACQ